MQNSNVKLNMGDGMTYMDVQNYFHASKRILVEYTKLKEIASSEGDYDTLRMCDQNLEKLAEFMPKNAIMFQICFN